MVEHYCSCWPHYSEAMSHPRDYVGCSGSGSLRACSRKTYSVFARIQWLAGNRAYSASLWQRGLFENYVGF